MDEFKFLAEQSTQWTIGAVGALLWLLMLWLEWKRKAGQRLLLRWLLVTGLAVSLVLMGLQPALRVAGVSAVAIALDAQTSIRTYDSLSRAYPLARVFALSPQAAERFPLAEPAANYAQALQAAATSTHWILTGMGPEPDELYHFSGRSTELALEPLPEGLSQVQAGYYFSEGDSLVVSGRYLTNHQVGLYLQGPSGTYDSVQLSSSLPDFRLAAYLPQAGRFLWQLSSEQDTLGQIPVQVSEKEKLRILLLASAPSFENRYLIDWLAARGHGLAARLRVSRDKYREVYANMPKQALNFVTTPLLQQFDLLIVDAEALQALGSAERSLLLKAVREEGIGLLVQAEEGGLEPLAGSVWFPRLQLSAQPAASAGQVSLLLPSTTTGRPKPMNLMAHPFSIEPGLGILRALYAESGEPQFAVQVNGQGRTALSLLQQTYPLQLQGDSLAYQHLWSEVLSLLAKPLEPTGLQVLTPWPKVQYPCLLSAPWTGEARQGQLRSPSGEVYRLAPAQDWLLEYRQHFQCWPKEAGWHSFRVGADSLYFYVQSAKSWEGPERAAQRAKLEAWALGETIAQKPTEPYYRSVGPWWFLLSFLLFATGLWLERKW